MVLYYKSMSDIYKKLLILRTPGIGPVKFNSLINRFGDIDSVVQSLGADVAFCDSVKREMDKAAQLGIHYLSDDDVLYPANLRKIKNHPPVISVRGNLDTLSRPMVSIVGTRHAYALCHDLA